jgi:hypothetical protein
VNPYCRGNLKVSLLNTGFDKLYTFTMNMTSDTGAVSKLLHGQNVNKYYFRLPFPVLLIALLLPKEHTVITMVCKHFAWNSLVFTVCYTTGNAKLYQKSVTALILNVRPLSVI